MPKITRRTGLHASAALMTASLTAPWRAFAQSAAAAASAPAPSSREQPQHEGPEGALLAERLKYEGVALAAMRVRDGATTFSGASARAVTRCIHQ